MHEHTFTRRLCLRLLNRDSDTVLEWIRRTLRERGLGEYRFGAHPPTRTDLALDVDVPTQSLDSVRFKPEHELIERLTTRFGLDILIDHFVAVGGVRSAYDAILATQLRLTPTLAPRLTALLAEAQTILGFHEPIELFVGQDPLVNASSMHRIADDEPHVVKLTSALVERMNDDELRFVLGHELGHLAFRHYRARLSAAAFGTDEAGASKAPALLVRRLESWDRLAEISADRAGLLVVGLRLDVAVSAFFKLSSGLGPEHLRFDVGAFLEQLADLEKLERRALLAEFSHPATPIRVRALQLFAAARVAGRDAVSVEQEVLRIARLMDFAPSEPIEVHARDFLLAASLLAGEADLDAMSTDEWEAYLDLLLPLSPDPEAEVARILTREDAEAMIDASASYLRMNAGPERYDLLRGVAHVLCADGVLGPGERRFLHDIAQKLDIPERAADEVGFEMLADHLQMKAMHGTTMPRPNLPRRAVGTPT